MFACTCICTFLEMIHLNVKLNLNTLNFLIQCMKENADYTTYCYKWISIWGYGFVLMYEINVESLCS